MSFSNTYIFQLVMQV